MLSTLRFPPSAPGRDLPLFRTHTSSRSFRAHKYTPSPHSARTRPHSTQRRTKIDWLEKVAQTFYACSLLFAPEWWLNENFVDKSLQNNDSVLALMSIMGLLCLTINIITFVIRNAKNTRVELMKKMDYVAAVTWSFFLVNAVRIQQDGLFEDAAHKQNLGIFAVIIAAEAYQSTTRKPKSK